MNNKNLLIGAVVLVVGYLLYKKSKINVKEYSENCKAQLESRLMQEDVKPPNFENNFLERCREAENSSSAKPDDRAIPTKNNDCEKKWNSKAEIDKGMIGSTRDARKEYFMYNCVNNIKPTVIYN